MHNLHSILDNKIIAYASTAGIHGKDKGNAHKFTAYFIRQNCPTPEITLYPIGSIEFKFSIGTLDYLSIMFMGKGCWSYFLYKKGFTQNKSGISYNELELGYALKELLC